MSRRLLFRCIAGLVLVQSPIGCATGTKPVDGAPSRTATPLPTDEGIPINQWYMSTTDADGARLSHYVAEYGVEAKPGNTVIVLHGGWGAEHSYLVPAIKPLADQYRFVLYDQRGSLRSPATPPAKVTYANLIEDLDQLRQRLGREPWAASAAGSFNRRNQSRSSLSAYSTRSNRLGSARRRPLRASAIGRFATT